MGFWKIYRDEPGASFPIGEERVFGFLARVHPVRVVSDLVEEMKAVPGRVVSLPFAVYWFEEEDEVAGGAHVGAPRQEGDDG